MGSDNGQLEGQENGHETPAKYLSPAQALHRSGIISYQVEIAALDEMTVPPSSRIPPALLEALLLGRSEAELGLASLQPLFPPRA